MNSQQIGTFIGSIFYNSRCIVVPIIQPFLQLLFSFYYLFRLQTATIEYNGDDSVGKERSVYLGAVAINETHKVFETTFPNSFAMQKRQYHKMRWMIYLFSFVSPPNETVKIKKMLFASVIFSE